MTTTIDETAPRIRRTGSPLPAIAGVGALAAFIGSAVTFGDPMSRADTAEEAAEALGQASPTLAAVLMGAYALLAIAVTGRLAVRIGRPGDTASARLTPLLGAGHVLLMTATVAAPAAAVAVGTLVLEGGVSPTSTEAALLLMNVAHPMAAWVGAGFLIAVATGIWADSRVLSIVSAVFAVGLLLPPVGWVVTYLMGFWFAGVGIWLWLRR